MAEFNKEQTKELRQFCVMLETEQWEWLRREAFETRQSMADIVRGFIDKARGVKPDGQGRNS